MSAPSVLVLELGSTHATAVVAAADGATGFSVRSVQSVAVLVRRRSQFLPEGEWVSQAAEVIRRVRQAVGATNSELVVTTAGVDVHASRSRGLRHVEPKGRHITHQDVLEVITHSRSVPSALGREIVQVLPSAFHIDGRRSVRRPVGQPASRLEVESMLVTAPVEITRVFEHVAERAQVDLAHFVYSPLAAGLGALTEEEIRTGALLLDIGGDTTDAAVFIDGALAYATTLPIGGFSVTGDIEMLLKTSLAEAERLKREHGHADARATLESETVLVQQEDHSAARPMQRRMLAEIVEARLREIMRMARQRATDAGRWNDVKAVVLTGQSARIAGIDSLAKRVLEQPARIHLASVTTRHGKTDVSASALGAAQFALNCREDVSPATGTTDWKRRVRSLFTFRER
jgi:cell division protein FtsA